MQLEENHALFGLDPTARIVSVELLGDRLMQVYRRSEDGRGTDAEQAAFTPFLWLAGEREGLASEPLGGGLPYDRLVRCETWAEFTRLRMRLRDTDATHFAVTDPIQQYLTASGRTLFKGLDFSALRRLQISVEIHRTEPSDHLASIALSDQTGWEELLLVERDDAGRSERAVLARLGDHIRARDPDVLEGHHIFKAVLPFLSARARQHRLKLDWGRDGSLLRSRASRVQIAERTINYPKFQVHGRHVVDTYLLVQFYDIGTRELESFELADVARHFGLAGGDAESAGERTYLPGPEIAAAYREGPARFSAHALANLREARAISNLLSRSYFTQAQIFPYNYQEIIVRGNATRIDALFLREYYRRRHSLPELPEARPFEGGYTDVFVTGVARDVWHCDVASLYPSVMLRYGIFPANDRLEIFRGLLADLRKFRLEAKAKMRESSAQPARAQEYQAWNALQNVFKILINSFYGYLGFSQGHFADYAAAARVTETGRDLLKALVAWLNAHGSRVIEIDTDGIYFVPPAGTNLGDLQRGLREVLPDGIDIEFDARYPAMFSYKAKNYALLQEDGQLILKGGALKSRGLEKFQRQYLERMIRLLLEGRREMVPALRAEFEQAIRERRWPIEFLAKTDTLQDSLGQYQKKVAASARNRSAPYELAARSGRGYQPGDQIRYYITGAKKNVSSYENAKPIEDWQPAARDENIEYYVSKLDELARKYEEFTGSLSGASQGELFS
jgi:DNA polymerase I